MIVVGAGGFATQLHDLIYNLGLNSELVFYDDVNKGNDKFLSRYRVLHTTDEVKDHFLATNDNKFV